MSDVLVVLTMWKRPGNLAAQLEAFEAQTHPVDIVVVDNRPCGVAGMWGTADRYGNKLPSPYDFADTIRIDKNAGPSCRFVPAYLDLDHKWSLFYDDDMIPEPGAVEWLVAQAEEAEPFSEIGVIGRNFSECHDGAYRYNRRNVKRPDRKAKVVDMLCRMHFFKTADISRVIALRHRLRSIGLEAAEIATHDDLLMLGISDNIKRPKLLPAEPEGSKVIGIELDDGEALHRNPGFMPSRNRLLSALQKVRVLY